MKFKTLKYCSPVDSKFDEFASIGEHGQMYTHEHPSWLGEGATIEDFEKYYSEGIDWNNYRIVEIEYYEANTVGADIRNKLTPSLNLLSLLKLYFHEEDTEKKKVLNSYINAEIKKSEENIKYIANLL